MASRIEKRSSTRFRKQKGQHAPNVVQRHSEVDDVEDSDDVYIMCSVVSGNRGIHPLVSDFVIDGKKVRMQIDTGASVSVMSAKLYREIWAKSPAVHKSGAVLRTYTGEQIKVVGMIAVDAQYDRRKFTVPLMIVDGVGPSLVGCDWLKVFKLKWAEICHIGASASHEPVMEQYPEVFQSGLGRVKNMTVKIHLDPLTGSAKVFQTTVSALRHEGDGRA